MSLYLGLNIGAHDSSATLLEIEKGLVKNAEIILSERITRKKRQGHFPFHSLKELVKLRPSLLHELRPENIAVNSIGHHSFEVEIKLQKNDPDYSHLIELQNFQIASSLYNPRINFVTHHLAHAYAAKVASPFEKALIVVSDGMGNYKSAFSDNHPEKKLIDDSISGMEYLTVYSLDSGKIRPLEKYFSRNEETLENGVTVNDGLGSLFEAVAKVVFGNWSEAGKVMGLAAFGRPSEIVDRKSFVRSLPQMNKPFREFSSDEFQLAANLSASVQKYFENFMLNFLKDLKEKYPGYNNVILTGGCALNCLLNARARAELDFKNIQSSPFPSDEGISLGAALSLAGSKGELLSTCHLRSPFLGSSLSGPETDRKKIAELFSKYDVTEVDDPEIQAANILSRGEIIAWFQGRSEIGPRALGNRSILVSPVLNNLKQTLNDKIKFREAFRPYGITILSHEAGNYFEIPESFSSPYMSFAPQTKKPVNKALKEVVHPDGTVRIQTVSESDNPLFHSLLKQFHSLTGIPFVVNTSLNTMGEPILETLEDALRFFGESIIEVMIINKTVIRKKKN